MPLSCRFGIISDPHIALPHTILDIKNRFHLVEFSIPAFDLALEHLSSLNIDFLLLPGDLTQHGEPDNHRWLKERLQSLPFPAYVVPGNHDIPEPQGSDRAIKPRDFSAYYQQFNYRDSEQLYYSCKLTDGLYLIALNSNQFDASGQQLGYVDREQLLWLENTLEELSNCSIFVMIHHNVIEHLPGQSQHELGKRYMLDNAPELLNILQKYRVKFIFTGHLHAQDIARDRGIYEITTGSLVSYPHPYRVLELTTDAEGKQQLQVASHRIEELPNLENFAETSRQWMGDRSYPFMMRLLTSPPLNLSPQEAARYAPELRYFWATIASGDATIDFPHFPPQLRLYFQKFGVEYRENQPQLIDNNAILRI